MRLSGRYINDRFLPDKAIDLMDEAASKVCLYGFARPDSLKKIEQQIKDAREAKEQAIIAEDFAAGRGTAPGAAGAGSEEREAGTPVCQRQPEERADRG